MNLFSRHTSLLHIRLRTFAELPAVSAALLAVTFFLLVLPLLGLPAIGGSSEAREAHVTYLISYTGEAVLPLRNGLIPSKPPLFHWLGALWAGLWGAVTPGSVRLTSLLAASGTVACTVLLANRFMYSRSMPSLHIRARRIGLLAGAILACTFGFTEMAMDSRVDMLLCFLVTLAVLVAHWRIDELEPDGPVGTIPISGLAMNLFFLIAGLAVLAKGPLGLVLPGLLLLVTLVRLAGARRAIIFLLRPRLGWLYFLLIAVPWYLFAYFRGSDAFIGRQLIFENLQRMTGGEFVNKQAWWYYLPALLRTAFPWSLVIVAWASGWLRAPRPYGTADPAHNQTLERLRTLPLVWAAVGLMFFSLASGKRGSYLLPLLPMLAIGCAQILHDWYCGLSDRARTRFWRVNESVLAASIVLFALLLVFFEAARLPAYLGNPLAAQARNWISVFAARFELYLFVVAAVVWHSARGRNLLLRSAAAPFALASLIIAGLALGNGIKAEFKGFDRIAAQVNTLVPPAAPLAALLEKHDESYDPIFFYLKRPVRLERVNEPLRLKEGFLLARASWFDGEAKELGGRRADKVAEFIFPVEQHKGRSDKKLVLLHFSGLIP